MVFFWTGKFINQANLQEITKADEKQGKYPIKPLYKQRSCTPKTQANKKKTTIEKKKKVPHPRNMPSETQFYTAQSEATLNQGFPIQEFTSTRFTYVNSCKFTLN